MPNRFEEDPELYGLMFAIRRSARYHSKSAGFYHALHKISCSIAVILSSAAVSTLFTETSEIVKYLPAVVAIVSTLDLVFGFSTKYWTHSDLTRKWVALERRLVTDDNPKASEYIAERLSIEETEPSKKQVLDILCHNDLVMAYGFERDNPTEFKRNYYQIGWFTKMTAHFFSWDSYKAKSLAETQAAG